jgi:hypothetical protein
VLRELLHDRPKVALAQWNDLGQTLGDRRQLFLPVDGDYFCRLLVCDSSRFGVSPVPA